MSPTDLEGMKPETNMPETDVQSISKGAVEVGHTDIGYDYYLESQAMDTARRDAIAKQVLRKIDFILLPSMCLIYLMSFLDKQTLNYANAYGLQADLGLEGRDYSWVASITNIGYLLFSYPSSWCLQRFPIGKFVSIMLLCWGTLLVATVGAENFAGIMALRFLLGGLEACIGPAWMLVTSMFWTRDEQPLRMCIWLGCNGISLMLGSGISWGLGTTTHTALAPWQLIFLQISIGIINGSLTNFTSALLKGFGYNSIETLKWQLPSGAFQLVPTVILGYLASRYRNITVLMSVLAGVPSIAGIIGIALIPLEHPLALTACCWLLGVIGAAIILNWSIVAANFAGHTKRMTVNGVNFICYAAGNIIGPFMFDPDEAPRYMSAIKALCGGEHVNAGHGDTKVNEVGFTDRTDKENPHFRYKL
ncbi:putative transporter [Colletotrichum sp. SAR 10_86]|nr:putative transporter [Colletotrichum sp. SAR 10_86]